MFGGPSLHVLPFGGEHVAQILPFPCASETVQARIPPGPSAGWLRMFPHLVIPESEAVDALIWVDAGLRPGGIIMSPGTVYMCVWMFLGYPFCGWFKGKPKESQFWVPYF